MKRGTVKRWLTQKLALQRKLTLGAFWAMTAMAAVAWSLELGLVVVILWVGFTGGSWSLALLIGGGILGAVQAFVMKGVNKELGDQRFRDPSGNGPKFSVAQPLSVVWTYALGQMETDMTGIERLLRMCCLPQRMTAAALFTKERLRQVDAIQKNSCAEVIRYLQDEPGKIPVETLLEAVELQNPAAVLRDLSMIDGVMFLIRDQAGLSLAPRLTDDIDEWLVKDRKRREAESG